MLRNIGKVLSFMQYLFRGAVALSVSKWVKRGASDIARTSTVTEVGIARVQYSKGIDGYQEGMSVSRANCVAIRFQALHMQRSF